MSLIAQNIQIIEQQLPLGTRLIAVTKTRPASVLEETYQIGFRRFGENKVQEMTEKYDLLPKDVEWHMIGHLQSNKVKYIAPFVAMIHSVDSFKLLQQINREGQKCGRIIECLLQIFIAQEETKFGLSEAEARDILESRELEDLTYIKIAGLMGMASNCDSNEQIRAEFRMLRSLFDSFKNYSLANVDMRELSMGMSGDYPIAVQEGSTLIRVGSAIFGER